MLSSLLRPSANVYRDPSSNFWYGPAGGGLSSSGKMVTVDNAMQVAAVYACVRVLAEAVASLPLKLYRRLPDGGKQAIPEDELYQTLHAMPNGWQTSFEFIEHMMYSLTLRGNFLAKKEYGMGGELMLNTIPIESVSKYKRDPQGLRYYYREDNRAKEITTPDVFAVRGLSADGMWGMTPIELQRNAIGLAQGAEEFGASLYKNGVKPSGVFQHPNKLTPEVVARLRESLSAHAGSGNTQKAMVLEEGMVWQQIAMTNEDAQFLETRKFQINEIARIFRVPPHMIQDLDKATFSNIEHMSLNFVVHSLRPWLVRIERAILRDLIFMRPDGASLVAEFTVDGLLRGDQKSRFEAYASAIQNEWMSGNEVRAMENLNPVDGGDAYRNPAINPQGSAPANAASPVLAAWARDIGGRIASRELKELSKRAKHAASDPARWVEWLAEFYGGHAEFMDVSIGPFCEAAHVRECDRVDLVQTTTRNQIKQLATTADPERLVTEWQTSLPKQHAIAIERLVT